MVMAETLMGGATDRSVAPQRLAQYGRGLGCRSARYGQPPEFRLGPERAPAARAFPADAVGHDLRRVAGQLQRSAALSAYPKAADPGLGHQLGRAEPAHGQRPDVTVAQSLV